MKRINSHIQGLTMLAEGVLLDMWHVEQIADLMHDTAFFVKDVAGRQVMVPRGFFVWKQ